MPYEIPEFMDGTVPNLAPAGEPADYPVHIRPADTVPNLRARQSTGALPPPCRGADCRTDDLLDAVRSRFRVIYPGADGQAKLRGKHLLILLPERDTHALESVRWLLHQHGDFSGKTGQVLLTPQAREWLGEMRGAGELTIPNALFHQKAMENFEKIGAELAALVVQRKLGAPPLLSGSQSAIGDQLAQWSLTAKRQGPEVKAKLENLVKNLLILHEMIGTESLVQSLNGQGMEQGLTVSVVTGGHAHLDSHVLVKPLPGIVLKPVGFSVHGKWSAGDLKTALKLSHFRNLENVQVNDATALQGRLLLVAVEGGSELREQTQGHLLSTLTKSPTGKVPVTLINLRPASYTQNHGQETIYLRDALASKAEGADLAWRKGLQALVAFMGKHAPQSYDLARLEKLDREGFVSVVRDDVDRLLPSLRDEGRQLLADYHKRRLNSDRLIWEQMKSAFHEIAEIMDKSLNPDEVHVVCLPLDGLRALMEQLPQVPDLMAKLKDRLLATQISVRSMGQPKPASTDLPRRGRDLTGNELLETLGTRFNIVLRNLRGQEYLAGKNILILLPEQDATQIALAKWLLETLADFSGETGHVHVNPTARAWLGNPAGALDIDDRFKDRDRMFAEIDDVAKTVNQIVLQQRLGEPLRYQGTSRDEMQGQFDAWMKQGGNNVEHQSTLTHLLQKLRYYQESLTDAMLPRHPPGGRHNQHLSFTVLAGPEAKMDWSGRELQFPGLVVTPAMNPIAPGQPSAQWSVAELSSSLRRQHNLKVHLFDLQGKLLPASRVLDRDLLLAGVEGDADGASELATRLVRGLLQSPKGAIPVNVLKITDSLSVAAKGQTERTLPDGGYAKSGREFALMVQYRDELLTHIERHAQPGLDRQSVLKASPRNFIADTRPYVRGIANPSAREVGSELLQKYETQLLKVVEMHTARWHQVFAELPDAMDHGSHPLGVHLLPLTAETLRNAASILRGSPAAKQLAEHVVVIKVAEAVSQVSLSPKIEVM